MSLLLGWYEPGRRDSVECRYNENKGYVVFSAMGENMNNMIYSVWLYIYVEMSLEKLFDS